MAKSVTTAVPSGLMKEWCITSFTSDKNDPFGWDLCANTTKGHESDFQTICCDGDLIDINYDFWTPQPGTGNSTKLYIDFDDLVCCHVDGLQPGGLQPINTVYTACSVGKPTPLASLAATNTDNAQDFLVTYKSASYGSGTVADWTTTDSATCLWVNTKSVDGMSQVTLPVPDITTLPPPSTDVFGFPISTTYGSNTRSTSTPRVRSGATTSPSDSSSRSQLGASTTATSGACRPITLTIRCMITTCLLLGLSLI